MNDLNSRIMEKRDELARVGTRGLNDCHATLDNHVAVLVIGWRIYGWKCRDINGEGSVRELAATCNLFSQCRRRREGQCSYRAKRPGVRDGSGKCTVSNPLHPTLHNWGLDCEHICELSL